MDIQIKQGPQCHTSNCYTYRNGDIKYIVIHFTSNNGDTALNNCNYFSGANRGASAHYFIGDDGIYQSVPDKWAAWAVGGTNTYKHRYCRNMNSIRSDSSVPDPIGRRYGYREQQPFVRGDDSRRTGGADARTDGQQPHPLVADAPHDHTHQYLAHFGLSSQTHAPAHRVFRFEDGRRHHAAHRGLQPDPDIPDRLAAEYRDGCRVARHIQRRDDRVYHVIKLLKKKSQQHRNRKA